LRRPAAFGLFAGGRRSLDRTLQERGPYEGPRFFHLVSRIANPLSRTYTGGKLDKG
jgi:hypothetical protein